jgi:hypothetical protein
LFFDEWNIHNFITLDECITFSTSSFWMSGAFHNFITHCFDEWSSTTSIVPAVKTQNKESI